MSAMPALTLLLVLSLLQAKPVPMDELIQGLSADAIEERSKAVNAIYEGWKTWSREDLERLRKHGSSGSGESALRAKRLVEELEVYRSIPDEVWRLYPDIGPRMVRSDPKELGRFMEELEARWRKGELTSTSIATLTIPLLGDLRETGIRSEGRFRSSEDLPTRTVDDQVRLMHLTCLYWLDVTAPPDSKRAWWKENRGKTEEELHLAALESPDERTRGSAIARLAFTRRQAHYARLFEVLRGVKEDYGFRLALQGLATLPHGVLLPQLKPYLADPRVPIRFAVVKLLPSDSREEGLDAILEAFSHPERVEYPPWETWEYGNLLEWLAETKDPRAMKEVLESGVRGGRWGNSQGLAVLSGIESEAADFAMLKALQLPDPADSGSGYINGVEYTDDRPCDMAAIVLSLKLGCASEFLWKNVSVDARNLNIEEIQNRCRKKWGKTPVPYLGPGVTQVSKDQVADLVPELTHDSPDRRRAAVTRLCELGPGCWRPFKALLEGSEGTTHLRLQEALADWKIRLRTVLSRDRSVESLKHRLSMRLSENYDAAFMIKEVLDFWLADRELKELCVVLTDGGDGPGKAIVLGGARRQKSDPPAGATTIVSNGATYRSSERRADLASILAGILKQFESAAGAGRGRQPIASMTLTQ